MRSMKVPIYICHAADFTDRKIFMEEQIQRLNLSKSFQSITWVTKYPKEELAAAKDIDERLRGNPYDWYSRCDIAGYGDVKYRSLRVTELSLALKHLRCYDLIAQGTCDYALILEDDAILANNFVETINALLDRLCKENPACIFLGNSANSSTPIWGDGLVRGVGRPQSRCTDSYLISNDTAEVLLATIGKPLLPIDFDMSYALAKNMMEVWHLQRPIVSQGSQNGKFDRTI